MLFPLLQFFSDPCTSLTQLNHSLSLLKQKFKKPIKPKKNAVR